MTDIMSIIREVPEITGVELLTTLVKGVKVSFKPDGTVRSDMRINDKIERLLKIHSARELEGTTVHGGTTLPVISDKSDYLQEVSRGLLAYIELQRNPPYKLFSADGIRYPSPLIADPAITLLTNNDLVARVHEFHREIREACDAEENIHLANLEVHVFDHDSRYSNTRQTELSKRTTSILIELTFAGLMGDKRSEYTINIRARSFSQLNPEEIVRRYAQYARNMLTAELPPSYSGAVIITGDAVKDVLGNPEDGVSGNPLLHHLDAQTVYHNRSRLKPRQAISNNSTGEGLTLISDPLLAYGTGSTKYGNEGMHGHDGMPPKKVVLVENGIVSAFIADNKYSQLTGLPATGPLGNIVILPGTKTMDELVQEAQGVHQEGVVIVDAFSWFNPDSTSGDFAAEIRTGRLFKGGKTYPIKGGTVSGNMFDAYGNMRFSKETVFTGNYHGPITIKVDNLTVSGK